MRLTALSVNNLPPACDIGTLTPFNFSQGDTWPQQPTRKFMRAAFSNNPSVECVDLVLDIENPNLHGLTGKRALKYCQRLENIAEATPGNLWDYNTIGNPNGDWPNNPEGLKAWKAEARLARPYMTDYAGVLVSCYPAKDMTEVEVRLWFTNVFGVYRTLHKNIGACVSHRYGGDGDIAPPEVAEMFLRMASTYADIIVGWQAEAYLHGMDMDRAAETIGPWIERLRKSA